MAIERSSGLRDVNPHEAVCRKIAIDVRATPINRITKGKEAVGQFLRPIIPNKRIFQYDVVLVWRQGFKFIRYRADDPAKDMNLMTEVLNKTPQELVPELVTWE